MAPEVTPLQSRRRVTRVTHNYREPDSDSDFELPTSRRTLPERTSRRINTYNEDTLSESSSSESTQDETPTQSSTRQNRRFTKINTRSITKTSAWIQPSFRSFKRRKVVHNESLKESPGSAVKNDFPQPASHIPPWQILEYQILFKIMQLASYPLYTGTSRDTGSVRWLLNTSELCISFHEACIGALMYSPPLLPVHRAHWVLNLLRSSAKQFDQGRDGVSTRRTLSVDFRKKIKRLDIEVKQLLIKKQGFDLEELISLTPLLLDLRLYHNHDELLSNAIWAQARFAKDRWSYGNLFELLGTQQIRLRSFEWNGRFLRNDQYFETIPAAHISQPMQSLISLSFMNLNVLDVEREHERLAEARHHILKAIDSLNKLEDLTFQGCNIIDSMTFAQIPTHLKKLSLIDCPHITSVGMHEYLLNKGSHLLKLQLAGNQALDLGFMTDLKLNCPKLEQLSIDLSFSDPTSYRDTEPLFDELLPNGPPTWPNTLSTIILSPLRSLSSEDAENFYNSLVAASKDLLHLKTLIIKTLLKDISWRDRAKMRLKWLNKFEEIFLFRGNPSLLPTKPQSSLSTEKGAVTEHPKTKRQSARIRTIEEAMISDSQENTDGEPRASDTERKLPRTGTCNIVLFELSDQRPAQDQYTEQDFLDEEPSDDGDWNGKDTEVMVPVYRARKYTL